MKINIKKLPKSEVEIEGELEADVFEKYFPTALKKLGENLEIDGFRKGKAPEAVLLSKIPEIRILEEMAELALAEHYPKIIEENKIDPISQPEIGITKLARHNPLGFKIKTAVLPEIKLPDYKEISKKVNTGITATEKNPEVTEKEVEDTILDIRKSRAPRKHVTEEAKEHVHKEPHSAEGSDGAKGEEHEHEHEEIKEELPEFNDEYVQALGPFKNVEDFKIKLKENIKLEKANQNREKTRLKIVEQIIDEAKMELPEILVASELEKILYRMESDISAMGLKFEDYLKHLNKTKDDIKKEFEKDAEKKAKLGLVLNKIAELEKIVADEEQVAREVAMILDHYKEADPERARLHAENILTNEKVFEFLENQN